MTLAEFLRQVRPSWFELAACRGEGPRLWFGPDGYEAWGTTRKREQAALELCRTCPVKDPCRAQAHRDREQGIWGGELEIDRLRAGHGDRLSTVRRERKSEPTGRQTA